ncbi:sensor histidine kinase [Nocardioides lianchengensis]|uniref:histidine kinase n=1 Tax=Nocardioides lianchengensis TaxID=1045774 RepID=A0A1G6LEQ7_9ACTN|nr:sensor histidine kinase [Nocardioides lianchengensis]NYG12582.1 signal transduction histidine kinase [Nocardioides lianchengensis]SDC41694.1 Signal transduction histidine kinase [Nocardioides lianchengensis]
MTRFGLTRLDVALATLCAGAMLVELWVGPKAEPSVLAVVTILAASLPVLVRRRWPVATFFAVLALLFPVMETCSVYNTIPTPAVICAFTLADQRGRRTAALVAALALPLTLVILQIYSPHVLLSWPTASYLAAVGLPFALGVANHERRAYTAALVEKAGSAERLRIARDVHDVVAHAMVSINVQAGVGAHLIDRDPAQAHAALRAIKQVSGDALTDLRAVLGVLRDAEAGADAVALPVQRLADLADLEGTGLRLSVDIDEAARALPASVDATGFRIVQEALTNTLKHSGTTSARVRVTRQGDHVVIEVVDDGGSAPAPLRATGTGAGVAGMRDRALAVGGSLEAGPRPEGGWRVAATLPVEVSV